MKDFDPVRPPAPPNTEIVRVKMSDQDKKDANLLSDFLIRRSKENGLEEKLKCGGSSRFVIGYVAGAVDAFCQSNKVTGARSRYGILEKVYETIFKEGENSSAIENFSKNQTKCPIVMRGVIAGGEDMFNILNRESATFPSLFAFLREPIWE